MIRLTINGTVIEAETQIEIDSAVRLLAERLTLKEMAFIAGVSERTVRRWKTAHKYSGRPISRAEFMAVVLGQLRPK